MDFSKKKFSLGIAFLLLALSNSAFIPFAFWKASNELDSNWTPQWSSLKAYWKMNGAIGSIGSGATLPDFLGTSNATTSATGLTYSAGKINQGVTYDGTAYFTAPNASPWNVCSNITVMVWVKWNAPASPGWGAILGNTKGASCNTDPSWMFIQDNAAKSARVNVTTSAAAGCYLISTGTPLDGNWHHLAFTYNSTGTLRFYIDGVEDSNRTCTIGGGICSATEDLRIGGTSCSWPITNGGVLDEVAIFNTVLTATEISTIYNRQKNVLY